MGNYSQQCETSRVVKEVLSFGSIKCVHNGEYIPHVMKNNVAQTGVIIFLFRYDFSFTLWVRHGSCEFKSSAVGTHSGLFLNISGMVLGGIQSSLVVSPLLIYIIYNPGLLIHRVDTDVDSTIRISAVIRD